MKGKKSKIILSGMALMLPLMFSETINAAAPNSYSVSSSVISKTQSIYTLPPQPTGQSTKGIYQDRQPLGYILKPGSVLTITNNSNTEFTIQLLNNNGPATINKKVQAHSTETIEVPKSPVPQTNRNGKPIKDKANDVDLVPFIRTPRINTSDKISCNVKIQGSYSDLPIFSYTNSNQNNFMNQWKREDSYALVQGNGFQILLPADAQSYVENMDKAPLGYNAKGQPKPVPQGQKYICHNLMDVLHFYDDVLYPTYNTIAGLLPNANEEYNKLVPGKYFYTVNIKGAGGGSYGSSKTEVSSCNDPAWLQPNWLLFHETGHGYQTREMKIGSEYTVEVSNNILGNYMYYHVLFNGNSQGADTYSWNYMGGRGANKERMETSIHDILVKNNWSWDQILPHNGGRGKHVGLVLLQDMVEKMTYKGWTKVYNMDRQQLYAAKQHKEKDLDGKLLNLWDLITKAAVDSGYDYTAIMNEIGKAPCPSISQEVQQNQNKVVNFLWYLMPKSSYSQVYAIVQKIQQKNPGLVYDSNFTLVTPDQTKALNLNGTLNVTFNNLPSSWKGKTISLMNGKQCFGKMTIGSDGKCSLSNIPLGTYTLTDLPNDTELENHYVTVTNDSTHVNSINVNYHSTSSSISSSSTISSSLKNSSSEKNSSTNSKKTSLINSSSRQSRSQVDSSSLQK